MCKLIGLRFFHGNFIEVKDFDLFKEFLMKKLPKIARGWKKKIK
jgi:hypothetical protein